MDEIELETVPKADFNLAAFSGEKMEKLLTITVPSYNVEKTLEQTLQSFLPVPDFEKMEVLVIDDGSKDSTAKIGKRYSSLYPESIRLIQKENGGHGSAINTGIRYATGKYFKVVDGDDWLDSDVLQALLSALQEDISKNTLPDLIYHPFCRFHDKTEKKEIINQALRSYPDKTIHKFDVVSRFVDIPMHSVTYKTSLLKSSIVIDENCYYVDAEYVLLPVPKIQTIQFFSQPLYMYRVFTGTQSMAAENMRKNIDHHFTVVRRMINFYEEMKNSVSDPCRDYMKKRILQLIETQYGIYYSFPFNFKVADRINDFSKEIYHLSPELYQASMGKSVRFLRMNPRFFYPAAKVRDIFRKRM